MRIAVVSDDGTTISQHFGRAPLYIVVTVEEGEVIGKEERAKTGHHTFAVHHHPKLAPGEKHGCGSGSRVRHESMAETISDCRVLIAGGMGWGARESLKEYDIEPIVTDVGNIDEAVRLYLEGKLANQTELLH